MKYFIFCSLAVAVLNSVADSIFDEVLSPLLNPSEGAFSGYNLSVFVYPAVSIALFIAGAAVFYRLTAKALKEESERRVKEQNLLFAAIVHDLKTPMTSVQGFAKALLDGKVKPEEQQEIFDIICRKCSSMDELVNALFEYARLGAEAYRPNFAPLNLCTLIRDIAAENYGEFEEHRIMPEVDIPEEEIIVTADKSELSRAFTNLIVNACRHNPDGIDVLIRIRKEKEGAVVIIADSGRDLPSDMDIFEPFVTENSARTDGHGSGLGLAIAKRIIDLHGGSIKVSRDVDGYTKAFIVTL